MTRVPVDADTDEGAIEAALGPDLTRLVRAREGRLTAFTEITSLRSPVRPRRAFLLEFSDGTKLKGRRLKSALHSDAIDHLGGAIGAGFSRIVDRRGDAQLLEWVEGPTLDSLAVIPAGVLRRCGSMLGTLHRLDVPVLDARDPAARPLPRSPDAFEKLERDADVVCGARAMDSRFVRRALDAAAANRPRETTLGIIHKDFCAANLVLDGAGSPVCIDNDGWSVGPHDLDLARTWYRWPMDRRSRSLFVDGYEESRSPASFFGHFVFWATCVLVGSVSWRLRLRVGGEIEPVERLKKLRGFLDGETAGADHPFWVV